MKHACGHRRDPMLTREQVRQQPRCTACLVQADVRVSTSEPSWRRHYADTPQPTSITYAMLFRFLTRGAALGDGYNARTVFQNMALLAAAAHATWRTS